MDKIALGEFSEEIRALLKSGDIDGVAHKMRQIDLSVEAEEFVFRCLDTNGYNPNTGLFRICESDNSEFLKLVELLKNKYKTSSK